MWFVCFRLGRFAQVWGLDRILGEQLRVVRLRAALRRMTILWGEGDICGAKGKREGDSNGKGKGRSGFPSGMRISGVKARRDPMFGVVGLRRTWGTRGFQGWRARHRAPSRGAAADSWTCAVGMVWARRAAIAARTGAMWARTLPVNATGSSEPAPGDEIAMGGA